MNRAAFYDHIRAKLFTSLSQTQVDRIEAVLDGLEERRVTLRHAAYILATAHHETDRFKAMEEYASGAAYEGRADLGNTQNGDGRRFKGRSYVMITGRRNYTIWSQRTGVDFVKHPEKVSEPKYAATILIDGMRVGTFTGKKLSDYSTYYNMRRVVNGTDRATLIAQYAVEYEAALKAGAYLDAKPGNPGAQPSPEPAIPDTQSAQEKEDVPSKPETRGGLFSSLLKLLASILRGGK